MSERRNRLPAEERRATILAAGAALFGERGYDAVTLEEVAATAGVTKPIVYRHFESKKDLYLALLARHRDDLPAFTAGAGGGGIEEIRRILDSWLSYAAENSHGWRMLFRDDGGDADVVAFRRVVQDRAREVMADFLRRSSPVPKDDDEVAAGAELIRGGLAALIVWWTDHPEVPRSALLEASARLLGPIAGET